MTERQKAAARENGRRSQGPVTREGREQIRAANLRHGLFSQARDVVLPALGEDAEDFQILRRGCFEAWPGADPSHVESLAAAMWRLERIDRRGEELDLAFARSLSAEAEGPPSSSETAALLRALSIEACALRDFLRISNRLRRESIECDHALTELPENALKTKKEGYGDSERSKE